MRQATLSVLLTAGVAAAPRAQTTALPIDDLLLEPAPRSAYLEHVRTPMWPCARRLHGEQVLGGLTDQQEPSLRDAGVRGHFTAEQLLTLLGHLGLDHPAHVRGSSLVLPAGGGEEARHLLADLRNRLPRPLTIEVLLRRTADGVAETLVSETVEAMPGRLTVVGEVVRRAAVLDYHVEIAQAAAIANPAVGEVRSGAMIALRPQLLPTGEAGLLEVVARHVVDSAVDRIDTGHVGTGPLDRATVRIAEVGRLLRVHPGATVVQSWGDAGTSYELTLRTTWQMPIPARPGGHDLLVCTLRGGGLGFRTVATDPRNDATWRDGETDDPWFAPDSLGGSDASWQLDGDGDLGPDGRTLVATDQAMWAVQAAALAWFERLNQGPTLELRWFDAPAGADWPADGSAPPDTKVVGTTRLQLVDGAWAATALRDERSVVHDWDVEVAQTARIPDPICRRIDAGLWCNVRASGDEIELEAGVSRVLADGRQQLTLSQPVFLPELHGVHVSGSGNNKTASPNQSPAMALLPDTVTVEHPTVASAAVHLRRKLAAGQVHVHRKAAPGVLGTGRELVLVVQRTK